MDDISFGMMIMLVAAVALAALTFIPFDAEFDSNCYIVGDMQIEFESAASSHKRLTLYEVHVNGVYMHKMRSQFTEEGLQNALLNGAGCEEESWKP